MKTAEQFQEEVMDAIYMNGSKYNDVYTLTLSELEQVAKEMWMLHVEETKAAIEEDRRNIAEHAKVISTPAMNREGFLSHYIDHRVDKDSIINAPQIEFLKSIKNGNKKISK